ncbi:MAG: hypothetical protein IJ794_00170 [Lachnospiraceae bacterium]|nr:hypothetical protein [Lachnospiraceae bacterium]
MKREDTEDFERQVRRAKIIVSDPRGQGVTKFDDTELNDELKFRKTVYLEALHFLESIGEL